jgi:hypothetical protein
MTSVTIYIYLKSYGMLIRSVTVTYTAATSQYSLQYLFMPAYTLKYLPCFVMYCNFIALATCGRRSQYNHKSNKCYIDMKQITGLTCKNN